MRLALAAVAVAAAVACAAPTVTVDPVAHGPASHPAVTIPAADPGAVASRWREGCPLDGRALHPTTWLERTGPDGTRLFLPAPSGSTTELPGPVSCGWPHTAADRDALAAELAGVPERDRWQWGDRHG